MNSGLEVGAATDKVIGTLQSNNQLEPNLWDKENLQEKVHKALGLIALKFVNSWDLSVEVPIYDIVLTGSTASYNWTAESDIDLHIIVDLASLHSNTDALAKFLNAKATIWNAQHNISLFGHPVEIYVQDVNEPHISAGVYSIANQYWIQRPTMVSGAETNSEQIYQLVSKYMDSIDYLQVLYDRGEYAEVVKRSEEIRSHIKRRRGESLHGEGGINSTFNLVFKVLRKGGLLQKLGDLHIKAYDTMMSLQEQPKTRTLEEVWEILSHPETGFHKRSPEQQSKIVESVTKILSSSTTEVEDRKSIVNHLKSNNTLKAGLKAVVYDLLEEGACQEYAKVIAEDRLMPFSNLGTRGNLIEKFQEHYKDFPNLSKRSFLEGVINITSATGNVNIGKGEVALSLLCKDVHSSTSSEGDLLVEGKSIEIKGSDARAISQKSGYRENSDKVILTALETKYDIKVPPRVGGFTQKLEHAFSQHVSKFPTNENQALSFIEALDQLLGSVYRNIKVPKLIVDSKMNSEYVIGDGDSFALNSSALERDLAKVLLEDYISHHNFDKWFYFNAKSFDYLLVGREEVLNEASTDTTSPIWLYVRDGTVRMTYGKFNIEEQVAKIGYHASFKQSPAELVPSETIQDAALAAKHQSKVGFLGTGLYYFGDQNTAKEYQEFMGERPDREGAKVFPLNVARLKMYTPDNADEFVNDLRVTTINLYHLQGEELREEIQEAAKDLTKYTHLTEQQLTILLAKFAKDIKNASKASDKTQLSNRLLSKFDGIDLSGTSKDHFGTGSVIFPKAIQKVVSVSQPSTSQVLQKQLA